MSTVSFQTATVAVVDPHVEDYADLQSAADNADLGVRYFASGNEALRSARGSQEKLWLINANLPDISGFDLAQMLRQIKPGARIFIVGDEYQVDDELQALTLGLTKYLCKPLEPQAIVAAGKRLRPPQEGPVLLPMPWVRRSSRRPAA